MATWYHNRSHAFDSKKYLVEQRQKLMTDVIVAILLYYSQYIEKQINQSSASIDRILVTIELGIIAVLEYAVGYKVRIWFRTSSHVHLRRFSEVLTVFTNTVLFVFARLYTAIVIDWAKARAVDISKDSIGYSLVLVYYGTIAVTFLYSFIKHTKTGPDAYRETYYTMVVKRVSFLFVYTMASVVANPYSTTYYDHLAELGVVAMALAIVTSFSVITKLKANVSLANEIIDTFLRIVVLVFARVCTNYITTTTESSCLLFHVFVVPFAIVCVLSFITKTYESDNIAKRVSMYLDDINLTLILYLAGLVFDTIVKYGDSVSLYLMALTAFAVGFVILILQSRFLYIVATMTISSDSFEFLITSMNVIMRVAVYTFTRLTIAIISQIQAGSVYNSSPFWNIGLPSIIIIVVVLFMPGANIHIMQYNDAVMSAR